MERFIFQGWHAVGDGASVDLGGEELASLWELSCPYMARILAVLKHSSINLNIVSSEEGATLLQAMEQVSV